MQNTSAKQVSKKVIYPELSYLINGILFDIKKELGQYAREKQYGDLLEKKLKDGNILYRREIPVGDTGNIIDFLIDGKIVIELKAVRFVTKDNFRQIQNYLQQTQIKLGLLVNFRDKFLKPVRIVRIDLN